MQPQNKTLADYVTAKKVILEDLKELGIPEEKIQDLYSKLSIYVDSDVEALRASQFKDTAYTFGVEIGGVATKHAQKIPPFLRQFAEHVAASILPLKSEDEIKEVVDEIPEMSDPYE